MSDDRPSTDELLGAWSDVGQHYRYGLFPQQVNGIAKDGRPFYFRHRHGAWTLDVGPIGADPDYLAWADNGVEIAAADGDPEPDEIDELITQHLGAGWISTIGRSR